MASAKANRLSIIIILFGLISFSRAQISFGQTVSSSCSASDEIIAQYKNDADRLASRIDMYSNIIISEPLSNKIMNALLAVYNATALPARDSVVTMFNIHTFPYPVLNSFSIVADTTYSWVTQLKKNIIPTGYKKIDSLLSLYNLQYNGFYQPYSNNKIYLYFKTEKNYNLRPLIQVFRESVPGVIGGEVSGYLGDGNDISIELKSNHIELIYSFGFGDCPVGCIYRWYWAFIVYPNCDVEYIGSTRNLPPVITATSEHSESITIFPNPFEESISINGITGQFDYILSDILGHIIKTGSSSSNHLSEFIDVVPGVYLLTVMKEGLAVKIRVIKK